MGIYADRVLPHLIKAACGGEEAARQRRKVVPLATGRVLEVGMGPALNLPFYDRSKVEFIWGLEPSDGMRRLAAPAVASRATGWQLALLKASTRSASGAAG